MAALQADMDRRMTELRETAAGALQTTGWILFMTVLVSALASIGGGALGARSNMNAPLHLEVIQPRERLTPATV